MVSVTSHYIFFVMLNLFYKFSNIHAVLYWVRAQFQSTPPGRGATTGQPADRASPSVSIHAPRAGGDPIRIKARLLHAGKLTFHTHQTASHLRRDTFKINALLAIPAKAGIQFDISRLLRKFWILAYVGVTTSLSRLKRELHQTVLQLCCQLL